MIRCREMSVLDTITWGSSRFTFRQSWSTSRATSALAMLMLIPKAGALHGAVG